MCKILGKVCILLGIVCIICSAGFVVYNHFESKNAEKNTELLLQNAKSAIQEQNTEQYDTKMKTVKVNGYDCIGILSVPVLDLELPILTDWSYAKLRKAPCLYYGSYYEKDFVIAAHNYKTHFGRLAGLKKDDVIIFTDVGGTEYYYKVVLLETLPPNATTQMITSGFDLSLYTCTVGGGSRVTVRCNLIKD